MEPISQLKFSSNPGECPLSAGVSQMSCNTGPRHGILSDAVGMWFCGSEWFHEPCNHYVEVRYILYESNMEYASHTWITHAFLSAYEGAPQIRKCFSFRGRQILTTNNHDSKGESWSEAAIIGWVTNMVDLINPLILFMESWDKPINQILI